MKKYFIVKDINEKVVEKIDNEYIMISWDEGLDSTLEDLADRLFPDEDGVDGWAKVVEVVEGDDDDLYNEWFDKGYLDDAAFATTLDQISMGSISYDKDALPLSIYRNGRKIYDIDQQLIDDIGSYGN